jgi:enamine deaminase RidA (YjgF/YER057c/UK114 family)
MSPRLALSRSILTLGSIFALAQLGCTPPPRQMGPPPGFSDNLEEKRFITVPGVMGMDGFSQAIKIGKRVYISGQIAVDSSGNLVGGADLPAQAARTFQNLRAILLAAGATPEDVVQLDFMIVGLKPGDLSRIQRVDSTFFPPGRHPVGSIVGVESLPVPGALLAINALAETKGLFPDRQQLQRYRQ